MARIPNVAMPVHIPARHPKACNITITQPYLDERTKRAVLMGYTKPRWVEFCEVAMRRGLSVTLYEARHTASKYITLHRDGQSFKVRFSDHKPIPSREARNDCNFFVGVTNRTVTTTGDAIRAASAFFGV